MNMQFCEQEESGLASHRSIWLIYHDFQNDRYGRIVDSSLLLCRNTLRQNNPENTYRECAWGMFHNLQTDEVENILSEVERLIPEILHLNLDPFLEKLYNFQPIRK